MGIKRGESLLFSRKAQVTIFIIVALVIVALVAVYFVFFNNFSSSSLPSDFQAPYQTFLSCLEEETQRGIALMEFRGGYIELPEFEAGSSYMPFSSQLNFAGSSVPYWYYISGNNIQKTQVPTLSSMEKELENFLSSRIYFCQLSSYYGEEYTFVMGANANAEVDIKEDFVNVDLNLPLTLEKGDVVSTVRTHSISVSSSLGKLYKSALSIYNKEMKELFLENYAVDILRLNAPVDGVELSCSPLIWNADEVFSNLQTAIEQNTLAMKIRGGDYSLNSKDDSYFVIDADISENVKVMFVNSKNWSYSFEVAPSDGSIMIAEPSGEQAGAMAFGMCYVPYHFIYDIKYPVLVQLSFGNEIFQFPLAVVLDNNLPRNSTDAESLGIEDDSEICDYKEKKISVNVYDYSLNPIDATIYYECFGVDCYIGKTTKTEAFSEEFPLCANGYISAKSPGYKENKILFSSTSSNEVDIYLEKEYDKEISLKVDSKSYGGEAIISFLSGEGISSTLIYPLQKRINLSEGQYEIRVMAYRNSSLTIPATTQEKCYDVPRSGVGGIVGLTEEKCVEVTIPSQKMTNTLVGGGTENYYILESELSNSNVIEINFEMLPVPTSIEQLQENYVLFEDKGMDVLFI